MAFSRRTTSLSQRKLPARLSPYKPEYLGPCRSTMLLRAIMVLPKSHVLLSGQQAAGCEARSTTTAALHQPVQSQCTDHALMGWYADLVACNAAIACCSHLFIASSMRILAPWGGRCR